MTPNPKGFPKCSPMYWVGIYGNPKASIPHWSFDPSKVLHRKPRRKSQTSKDIAFIKRLLNIG
jgi:hypothetical protein